MNVFANRDEFLLLPEIVNRDEYIKWAQGLMARSQGFADRNRLVSVFISPPISALLSFATAGGVATWYKGYPVAGAAIAIIAAGAAALNTLFRVSNPRSLAADDRLLQGKIWREINRFKQTPSEEGNAEQVRCRAFGVTIMDLVVEQLERWRDREQEKQPAGFGRRKIAPQEKTGQAAT